MDTRSIGKNDLTGIDLVKERSIEKIGSPTNKEIKSNSGKENWHVELSDRSKNLAEARQKALEIAKSTEGIREGRISELKEQIASGQYRVDAGKVADGMLREAIRDHVANDPGINPSDLG